MGPSELGELESVVALLQRSNEEHKAYRYPVSTDMRSISKCRGTRNSPIT
jgi:hypothetical protein